ncbi:MAG: RidA family protein [Cyclonatronaceae bacterium]
MFKQTVSTIHAPAAIGPYNQAVIYDQLIFCSGQIGLDPETGEMSGSDTAAQMGQVMKNLGEVLKAAGSDWEKVLKCTIYLADMEDFSEVNDIYAGYFPTEPPAREAVAVRTLPKNARVEISCIAHR